MEFFLQLAVTAAFVFGIIIVAGLCALFILLPNPGTADRVSIANEGKRDPKDASAMRRDDPRRDLVDTTGWFHQI
ncbi:MAG: hypothetical protein AAGF73_08900 [Actinomycetota bacterium]